MLDEVDVSRRGTSRANSVRFDESAIQSHWVPESHSSSEYLPPRSSGVGGPLMERSLSYKSDYKSDGRQSSMRSFDNFSMAGSEHDCTLPSALRPRDIIECNTPSVFDAAPAVIRCWLGMDCSYDSILFALICTGSSKSFIDSSLVFRCGFKDKIWREDEEERISLSLFLGSASVPTETVSSHTTLPRLKVEFTVVQTLERPHNQKLVQIVLGSDILSAIKADVMFSKRQLNFQVRNGQKVYVDFESDALSFDIFDITPHGSHVHPVGVHHKAADEFRTNNEPDVNNRNGDAPNTKEEESLTAKDDHSDQAPSPRPAVLPASANDSKPNIQTAPPSPQKEAILSLPRSVNPHDDLQGPLDSNADLPSTPGAPSVRQTSERAKTTTDGPMKGPYAVAATKALTGSSSSAWDNWRKGDGNISGLASGSALNSPKSGSVTGFGSDPGQRRASRSMKVLRPSASKVGTTATTPVTPNATQVAFAMDENVKMSSNSMNGCSLNMGPKSNRSSSLEAQRPTGRTKSRSNTNVVGGATAFKWMSGTRIGNSGSSAGGSGAE